ncbi:MAG: hypothetical protein H8E44_00315, partial [Planctomycetes bacterium]|nr:hypothetical protein [Planctomycetota bacterium]
MSNGAEKKERHATLLRTVIAVGIGLIGAVLIWVVTPWNNNYFGLSELSGSYLPTGALFLLFILALGVNPLLRSFAPSLVLTRSQLLVITAILLMASVHPSHGLMRYLPSMLAGGPFEASATPPLAAAYAKADVPPALFPAKMEAGAPVPASSHFMDELPEGQPIPWRAWLRPLAAWGSLLGFGWLMLLGLSVIVYNQWCRNERLPFPLAEALGAPLAEPERGRRLPPIFNEPAFWAAVG